MQSRQAFVTSTGETSPLAMARETDASVYSRVISERVA
jgi:hypothetical protein